MNNKRDRVKVSVPRKALLTNLAGVYALPPPPEDFCPVTADNKLLKIYGLPLRPDAKENPQALRAWKRAFSRPIGRFIQPPLHQFLSCHARDPAFRVAVQ